MAHTWAVSATGVEIDSVAIPGYLGHEVWMRVNNESNAFVEVGLVVRVDDALSESLRDGVVAVLPAAIRATLAAENTLRPTTREIKPAVGDTITFSGISNQVLTGVGGTAADTPGSTGGTDPFGG
jgi:hypothetical protein